MKRGCLSVVQSLFNVRFVDNSRTVRISSFRLDQASVEISLKGHLGGHEIANDEETSGFTLSRLYSCNASLELYMSLEIVSDSRMLLLFFALQSSNVCDPSTAVLANCKFACFLRKVFPMTSNVCL